jgi:tetratricopeptide (TPR) repeat protein
MWDLAVREDDYQAVDGMLQRFAGAPLSMRAVPAYARHDTLSIARLREELRNLDARQSQIAARYVATFLEDFPAAEELARLDLQPRRNASIRLGAQIFLAWLEVARGRWGSANRAFVDAEGMPGGSEARIERALAATLPFLDVPRADLETIRREIDSWNPASETASGGSAFASALRPHLRLYLLGLLSSRLRDDESASRYAHQLEMLAAPEQARNVVVGLVATVRADMALRNGRTQEALQMLAVANGEVPLELVYLRPFVNSRPYTQEHARYLRTEALLALGRDEEAQRWLETGFLGSPAEFAYLAPTHLRLARVAEKRGDRRVAAEHLRSFTKLWRESDEPLHATVKEAEARLRQLERP